jgi:hypothetical protein
MQSTLKDTDPHDVFAIESLLHAHAEKAPPLAHDPAAPPAPQVHVAPQIAVGAPIPQVEPTFRATDTHDIQIKRDIPVDNVRSSEIKVDGLKPLGESPTAKWVKRLFMTLLALCGAIAAAGWQHYGDQAKAMAAEWTPPFVLAALPSATKSAVAEQPSAPAAEPAATDQAAAQPAEAAAVAAPVQPEPAASAATAPSADAAQLQSMAKDLAAMGQQVEELKTTIAQLRASQAQMARELAKASETRASETRPPEQNLRPKPSALTPPPPRQAAPPPVRKPKQAYSYSPAPMAAAPAAPLPPAQAAAPMPPAPPPQTIADDGAPVVRPPMPLR